MLYSDPIFFLFLIVLFALWGVFPTAGRKALLVAASLVFYAWFDLRFLPALGLVWLVVWLLGPLLARWPKGRRHRAMFWAGVLILLGQLFLFKYLAFAVGVGAGALARLGLAVRPHEFSIVAPIGISFYTFQSLSYLIDVHHRRVTPSRSPLDTLLYVTFFPMLLAGPIERGAHWLPQVQARQRFSMTNLQEGIERMLIGYLLKVGVADPVAGLGADILARVGQAGSGELTAGMYLYAIQVFADFAGYSLIARGVARLFGYEIVPNFEQPYFSRSFSEFWRRWHISLSSWIFEYVHTPLMNFFVRRVGRWNLDNPATEVRIAYAPATIITMLLVGLWHGAGFSFIVWGLLHGLFLTFERTVIFGNRAISKRFRYRGWKSAVKGLLAALVVFHLVCLTFIFFRADSLSTAWLYIARMFAAGGWVVQKKLLVLLGIGAAVVLVLNAIEYRRNDERVFRAAPGWARGILYAAAVLGCVMLGGAGGNVPFIYFKF